jgi:hypothetical protein
LNSVFSAKIGNLYLSIFTVLYKKLLTSSNNSCKRLKGLIFFEIIDFTRYKRRNMNSKLWIQKALSMCLVFAIIATYSTVALAGAGKIAGELLVAGTSVNGETPYVIVNGEAAKSGRSVFSASTIATPDNANAVINLGKIGKIELAPNTNLVLSFTEKGISGDLLSGKLTVLNASESVAINTASGETLKLNAGESASANGKAQDDADKSGGAAWLPWALIFGGAVAAIVIATVVTDNETQLGGNSVVVSTTR